MRCNPLLLSHNQNLNNKNSFSSTYIPNDAFTWLRKKLTTEQEAQKQQLINEYLHNIVFIKGNTFLIGDFGNGHNGKSTLFI